MKENTNKSNNTSTNDCDRIQQDKSENLLNQSNIYPLSNESTIHVIEEDQSTLNGFLVAIFSILSFFE